MSLTPAVRAVIALGAGLLVACGFAPVESLLLMLAGLILFVTVLYGCGVRLGAGVGAAFGLGFFGLLVSWVGVLGVGVWIALAASQVAFMAAFGAGASVLRRLPVWPAWWAALWVAVEAVRSTLPIGGFPWGKLAYATVGSPLESFARLLGTAALSGVVFGLAAFAVYAWFNRTRLTALTASAVGVVSVVALSVVLPVGVAGPDEGSASVAVIQGGVPGTGANGLGEQREVLENHVDATLEYARAIERGDSERPEAVFWPENASDIDPLRDQEAGAAIDGAAQAVGVPILVGAVLDGADGKSPENAGIVWDNESGAGDTYLKRHLVPFGEYVPFRGLIDTVLPYVTREIPRDMTAGEKVGVLDLGPMTVGDMMCYDVAYNDAAYDPVDEGADVLVVQTNNATYSPTNQPDQQWQLAQFRAIETGRDVIVPSTNGVSGVATAAGDVLAKSDSPDAQVLEADVTLGSDVTPAVRFGSALERIITLIALGGIVAGAVLSRLSRRRRATPDGADDVSVEVVR